MKYLTLFIIIGKIFTQEIDPYELINKLSEEFNKVEDYQVNVTITVDVNFLKVPETKATIYFKQPDKVKMDSEGFALLPKEGLNFSPAKLLENEFTAIYTKSEAIDGAECEVIKVVPLVDTTDVILSSLWIDPQLNVIRKIETTTKRTGTFGIDLAYNDSEYKNLPSEVKFIFNVENLELPVTMTGELDKPKEEKKSDSMTGVVIVKYDNYILNQGLSDSFFEEENSPKEKVEK
ncbi:MAG: hypothetical protein PVH88_24415 [Ignavibacteria bacterium]|jgi:outer membrane lipoprotein-sorting protein